MSGWPADSGHLPMTWLFNILLIFALETEFYAVFFVLFCYNLWYN